MNLCFSKIIFLALLPGTIFAAEPQVARICYLSLNNRKESLEAAKFVRKVNEFSEVQFEVKELFDPTIEKDPNKTLEDVCSSGLECDGFVLSGHHVSDWYGDSVSKHLDPATIDKLSCNPKCRDFFENIRAVWAQGCNTLEDPEERDVNARADIGMRTRYRQDSGHELQLAQLERGFIGTRNGSNPLSTQWMRSFPRATIFGWTDFAPGVNEHSEYSIPWHMAHILKVRQKGRWAKDPLKDKIGAQEAAEYALALEITLKLLDPNSSACDEEARKGWISHGHHKKNTKEPGFLVHAIDAYPPLMLKGDPLLLRLRESFCAMNFGTEEQVLGAIDTILSTEDGIGYSFSGVWDLIKRLGESERFEDKRLLTEVLKRLNTPPNSHSLPYVQSYMRKNLADPDMPLLGKLDFYAFYKVITLQREPAVEKVLVRDAFNELVKAVPAEHRTDYWDYKLEIIESLKQSGLLLSPDLLEEVLGLSNKQKLDPTVLGSVIKIVDYVIAQAKEQTFDASKMIDIFGAFDFEEKLLALAKNKGMNGFTRPMMLDLFESYAGRLAKPDLIYYELVHGKLGDATNLKLAETHDFLVRSIDIIEKAKLSAEKRRAVVHHLQSAGLRALTNTRTTKQDDFDVKERITRALLNKSIVDNSGYPEAIATKLLQKNPSEFELRLALYPIEFLAKDAKFKANVDILLKKVTKSPNFAMHTAHDVGRVLANQWEKFSDPEAIMFSFLPLYQKEPRTTSKLTFLNVIGRLPLGETQKLRFAVSDGLFTKLRKTNTTSLKTDAGESTELVKLLNASIALNIMTRKATHEVILDLSCETCSNLQVDQAALLIEIEADRRLVVSTKNQVFEDLQLLMRHPKLSATRKAALARREADMLRPPAPYPVLPENDP